MCFFHCFIARLFLLYPSDYKWTQLHYVCLLVYIYMSASLTLSLSLSVSRLDIFIPLMPGTVFDHSHQQIVIVVIIFITSRLLLNVFM